MIYADHAATTKMSAEAMAAMVKGWEVYGNPSSLHTIGQEAAVVLQKAREQIAVCLDADPKEIYFTSGGSEADNQALRSAAAIGKRKGHMHIISTAFEHHHGCARKWNGNTGAGGSCHSAGYLSGYCDVCQQ